MAGNWKRGAVRMGQLICIYAMCWILACTMSLVFLCNYANHHPNVICTCRGAFVGRTERVY